MAGEKIRDDVARLLATRIQSVIELEVLLYLRRNPGQELTAAAIARAMYIDPAGAAGVLEALQRRGFLAAGAGAEPTFRYQPSSPELARALDELDRIYAERRVTIISLIFSKPNESLRMFSDAFRFRKDT